MGFREETPIIQYEGESWHLLGVGTRDGEIVFCHLAHRTRGRQQKNGFVPAQINDWVPVSVIPADRLPA